VRELRSLLSAQQEKVAGLESEAAELKLLHTELKHEVLVLKVRTHCTHSTVVHTTCHSSALAARKFNLKMQDVRHLMHILHQISQFFYLKDGGRLPSWFLKLKFLAALHFRHTF